MNSLDTKTVIHTLIAAQQHIELTCPASPRKQDLLESIDNACDVLLSQHMGEEAQNRIFGTKEQPYGHGEQWRNDAPEACEDVANETAAPTEDTLEERMGRAYCEAIQSLIDKKGAPPTEEPIQDRVTRAYRKAVDELMKNFEPFDVKRLVRHEQDVPPEVLKEAQAFAKSLGADPNDVRIIRIA